MANGYINACYHDTVVTLLLLWRAFRHRVAVYIDTVCDPDEFGLPGPQVCLASIVDPAAAVRQESADQAALAKRIFGADITH